MRHHPAPRTAGAALRRVVVTLTTALVALAGLAVPATVAAAPAHAAQGNARAVASDFDAQVVHWTNVVRKRHGLRPLKARNCVDRFARGHTKRLARRDAFYHQALRPVLRQCGMRTAGENIAWRSPSLTGRKVVRMWMASPGHRRNILAKKYKYIGVDAYRSARTGRVYAGQVFGG